MQLLVLAFFGILISIPMAFAALFNSNTATIRTRPSPYPVQPSNQNVDGHQTSDKSFGDSLACFFTLGFDRDAYDHQKMVRRSESVRPSVMRVTPTKGTGNLTDSTNSTSSTNSTIPRPMATLQPKPVDQPVVSQKHTELGAWLLCMFSLGYRCNIVAGK